MIIITICLDEAKSSAILIFLEIVENIFQGDIQLAKDTPIC